MRGLPGVCALAACLALAACASTTSKSDLGPRAAGIAASPSAAPQTVRAASASTAPAISSEQLNREFQHAQALYLSGHLREAAAAFEELSRKSPRDSNVWFRYGNTLTKLNNYDEAATAYNNAVSLDPGQGPAALNLALVRLAQAQQSLDLALARLPPGSPEHAQADGLQRQIRAVLGAPERGAAPR
jgi:tetratricopeptide (TPR) repeat protein